MTKLSVIIPVYNVEKYLRKCLNSVICPELSDYEIVIVNDGSTDRSQSIIDDYFAKYPQLMHVISTPNNGSGGARNIAIDNASGEYLLFLDSDDYLAPGAISEMLRELNEPFDIYFFGMISVNESGRILGHTHSSAQEGRISLSSHPSLLAESPCACGKIIRRSLFTDSGVRFPNRVWYEDLRTIPKLYIYANTIINRVQNWYYYVQHSGSITNSNNAEKNLEIIDAVDDVLNFYSDAGNYDEYQEALEFTAFHHELLTATTRVNLIDMKSSVQDALLKDFCCKFPNYRNNPYIQTLPFKHKLLLFFIEHRMHFPLNIVMQMNNRVKRKEIN